MLAMIQALNQFGPEARQRARQAAEAKERAMARAVAWREAKFPRDGSLVAIDALSYEVSIGMHYWVDDVGSIEPTPHGVSVDDVDDDQKIDFGKWRYLVRMLPRGGTLHVYQGNRVARVVFNADVRIPALFECTKGRYRPTPAMSLTPMEQWSLAPGVRAARGHTVVAGLGLGWTLVQIAQKRSVKRITLVEQDADLIATVMPRIAPWLKQEVESVICDDATKVIPKMQADVAVVDIANGYGGNTFPHCSKIGKVWVWGSAAMGGERW